MEIAFTTFMTTLGFTFAEIIKMLLLVMFSFVFQGFIFRRLRKPIFNLYQAMMNAMQSVPKLETSVAELNKTMQEHMIQTDLRIDMVEESISDLKKFVSSTNKSKED